MRKDIILNLLFSDINNIDYDIDVHFREDIAAFIEYNNLLNYYMDILNKSSVLSKSEGIPFHIQQLIKENSIRNRKEKALIYEMNSICEYMNNHSIKYLIVKGVVLSQILYNDSTYRTFGDIDIILCDFEKNCLSILKHLKENGYSHALGWGKKSEINTENIIFGERFDHHEIPCTKGINDLYCVEIKNTLSAIPHNVIDEFNKHTEKYNIDGNIIESYDLIHTFIALCSNIFINSESRTAIYYYCNYIRLYYDLYIFIKKYNQMLDIINIAEHSNKYKLIYRIERVFNNLLSFLTYNEEISINNKIEIKWIKDILEVFSKVTHIYTEIPKDIFLEEPNLYEIVDWKSTFIDRTFGDYKKECIVNYKQQFIKYELPPIDKDPLVNFNVKMDNSYLSLIIDFNNIDELCYKVELLSNEKECDVMFYGFLINKETIHKLRSQVFISNSKHFDKYTNETINIKMNPNSIECDISCLIDKTLSNNKKFIIRISIVQHILEDMYQEIDSASYQYCLE